MATTVVSNLAVFSDATGHGNQSHLVYAVNQQRWWCFVVTSKTATTVAAYVSSSADLTTATWSAGTSSPAFPSSRVTSTNDQRNLGVCSLTNGVTDAAHLSIGIGSAGSGVAGFIEHIRCTFTGSASITWDATWSELSTNGVWDLVKGNALAASGTSKFIHDSAITLNISEDAQARKSTNGDASSTWTTGFAAAVIIDSSITHEVNAYAFAPLASDVMLCVYENGGGTEPNCTGLGYIKSGATGTWSAGSTQTLTGNGTTSQDQNDWCLCPVDVTHTYAFRRTATGVDCRVYSGSAWSTPASTVPSETTKAGSGLFTATDGTDLYLFALDSTGNQAVKYVKGSSASGTISFDGTWTTLEAAGASARNYISGCPAIGNGQAGVVFTQVNGSNFDVVVTALALVNVAEDQYDWRWRNDDGSESAATWAEAEEVDGMLTPSTSARLRVGVNATGNTPPPMTGLKLQYRQAGATGDWQDVENP